MPLEDTHSLVLVVLDMTIATSGCFLTFGNISNLRDLFQVPYRIYFGREVACTDRSIIHKYGLPHRKYLGPTSMDTEMAFIMCNQGQVCEHIIAADMH